MSAPDVRQGGSAVDNASPPLGGSLLAVLLQGAGSLSPVQIARAAATDLSLRFVVGADDSCDLLAAVAAELAPTVRVDLTDLDACRRAVAGADAVATFSDPLCPLVCRLSGTPGLWGRKDLQRRALWEAGVSQVRSCVLSDADALRRFAKDVGWPLVVKPADGVSGRDVWLVRGEEDVHALVGRQEGESDTGNGSGPLTGMFAEQYISGGVPAGPHLADYVSVEVFVSRGRPRTAFITDRLVPAHPCRETGLLLPTNLPPDQQRQVAACATEALEVLEVADGAFHIEVKPGRQRPEVVEVNGRLGGYVARLAHYAAGADVARTALDSLLSRPYMLRPEWRRAVLVLLYPAPLGAATVTSVPSRRELARLPGVLAVDSVAQAGEPVDWRSGAAGNVATLWLGADDHDALCRRLADAVSYLGRHCAFAGLTGAPVRDDTWWTQMATAGGQQ